MIDIQDLNLLRITKVKEWAICFDYGEKHYLLHGQSEMGEGSWQVLYERTLDECGKYHLERIKEIDEREKPDQIILLGDLYYHGPRNKLPDGYNSMETSNVLNSLKEKLK